MTYYLVVTKIENITDYIAKDGKGKADLFYSEQDAINHAREIRYVDYPDEDDVTVEIMEITQVGDKKEIHELPYKVYVRKKVSDETYEMYDVDWEMAKLMAYDRISNYAYWDLLETDTDIDVKTITEQRKCYEIINENGERMYI